MRIFIVLCALSIFSSPLYLLEAKELTEDSLKTYLKKNPHIILDVLRENSVEVLGIVIEGSKKEAEEELQKQTQALVQIWNTEKTVKKAILQMSNRPYLGVKNASVTMVAFSDFLCPYCSDASSAIKEFIAETDSVFYTFKNYSRNPLSQKIYRYFLALWEKSPETAWRFSSTVFANQSTLRKEKQKFLDSIVIQLGEKPEEIAKLSQTERIAKIVQEDLKEGDSLKIKGTPMLLVNGRYTILGAVPVEILDYAKKYAIKNP